jgi:hypothetical protein
MKKNLSLAFLYTLSITALASGTNVHVVPCMVIGGVFNALRVIVPTFVMIFFLAGVIKYVFNADNPGGRKQGRDQMIHAVLGGIALGIVEAVVHAAGIMSYLNECQVMQP